MEKQLVPKERSSGNYLSPYKETDFTWAKVMFESTK